MKVFTILTGICSVLSILLPFIPNLQKWKLYFWALSIFLGGLTIGIITSSSEKAINSFSTQQLLTVILFISMLTTIAIFAYITMKKEQLMMGYVILFMGIPSIPLTINQLVPKKDAFSPNEYLITEKYYEEKGDFSKCIQILNDYKELDAVKSKDNLIKATDKLILQLDSMEANKVYHK